MIKIKKIVFLSLLSMTTSVAFCGCQTDTTSIAIANHTSQMVKTTETSKTSNEDLVEQARRIQTSLAKNEFFQIADDIHPTKGVRFSMYAYIDPKTDKVFSKADFLKYLQNSKIRFTWGELDGIGDLLIIPLPQYLKEWVKAEDFQTADFSINRTQATRSTSQNNLNRIYPITNNEGGHEFVEFYFMGTKQYEGMDWRVMRLVFEQYQGKRYLVAIINDQWTI